METLDNTVNNFLIESGYGDAEYSRAYHIGLRGLRELHMDVDLGNIATAKLFINGDGTADLPEGCLKVTRIYRLSGKEVVSLTYNKDISKLGSSGCICSHTPCKCRPSNIRGHADHYYGNIGYPHLGVGSLGRGSYQNYGEYNITGDVVYLSQDLLGCTDIFVDYKQLPCNEEGDYYVHPYIREALIAYIRWVFHINRKNQDKWDKQYFEREWHRLKRNAVYRIKSPTKQELNQNARQHTKLGLKS